MTTQLDSDVRTNLTPAPRKRRTPYRETIDFLGMVRRIVRAAGKRVGEGDLDELRALAAIRDDLDLAMTEAVRGSRANGATWSEIGSILGVTKQSAQEWFARREALNANA